MYCSQFKFAPIYLVFLLGIATSAGGKPYCKPSSEGALKECNWCFCVDDGLPICTTMDCTKVPKELWGNLNFLMQHKQKRLLVRKALDAAQGVVSIGKMLGSGMFNTISSLFGGNAEAAPAQ